MEQVFSYIIGLGAAVMMPILFFILGVCIGIKPGKALKSGLLVGVVQSLMTTLWAHGASLMIYGAMAAVILVRPYGLFGRA